MEKEKEIPVDSGTDFFEILRITDPELFRMKF